MKKVLQKLNDKLKSLGLFLKKKKPPAPPELPQLSDLNENENIEAPPIKSKLKHISLTNIKNKIGNFTNSLKSSSAKKNAFQKFLRNSLSKTENFRKKIMKTRGGKKFFTWLSSIQWRNLSSDFLSASNRPTIHKFFLATILILATYNTGKTIGHFLKGDSDLKPVNKVKNMPNYFPNSLAAHNRIQRRNIFDLKDDTTPTDQPKIADTTKKKETGPCLESKTNSTLGITLLDTTVLQDSVKSIASVQVRNGADVTYIREGEKLDNVAQIGRIGRLEIIYRNLRSGECEKVVSKDAEVKDSKQFTVLSPERGKKLLTRNTKSGVKNEENTFTVPRAALDEKLKNINKILTEAKAIKIE